MQFGWFVETLGERKIVNIQEMKRLLMEFSKEKECLLTMVVEQRLVIESLLLRVEKLEDATKGNVNGEEIPYMEVLMIVDESPSIGDGKIISENPSKKDIREKTGIK